MPSPCGSAVCAAARSAAFRSRSALSTPFASRKAVPLMARSVCTALVCTGSLMPLHSAIASARLKSFIAEDSSRWFWLSQELAVPR